MTLGNTNLMVDATLVNIYQLRGRPSMSYKQESTKMSLTIALIAHDKKKPDILELAKKHSKFLLTCKLIATGTTGGLLQSQLGLEVERLLSGPLGGDLQIGSRLSVGEIDVVIFLRDPMTPQPHEPDINALVRACDVHNIPCATNKSTAELLLNQLQK